MGFPQDWERIEIWRDGWGEPSIVSYRQMDTRMNVAGLYWRPIY